MFCYFSCSLPVAFIFSSAYFARIAFAPPLPCNIPREGAGATFRSSQARAGPLGDRVIWVAPRGAKRRAPRRDFRVAVRAQSGWQAISQNIFDRFSIYSFCVALKFSRWAKYCFCRGPNISRVAKLSLKISVFQLQYDRERNDAEFQWETCIWVNY